MKTTNRWRRICRSCDDVVCDVNSCWSCAVVTFVDALSCTTSWRIADADADCDTWTFAVLDAGVATEPTPAPATGAIASAATTAAANGFFMFIPLCLVAPLDVPR